MHLRGAFTPIRPARVRIAAFVAEECEGALPSTNSREDVRRGVGRGLGIRTQRGRGDSWHRCSRNQAGERVSA